MSTKTPSSPERRSFLTRLNTGLVGLAAVAGVARAQKKPAADARWEPARHDKDDWMDALPGKHRMVIDTTSGAGVRNGLLFASNFFVANRNDYGLQNQDIAIIVVVRHLSTGYGFNNDMWSKYAASLAGEPSDAKEPQKANPSTATLATLASQGVQFAVCSMATRRIAGMIASSAGISADAAFAELSANLVGNARLVSAGIVAVNRAQERGYSFVSA